ncbi:MAG: Ig-like domain-containing protein [Pseudomonadota bacterium]|nr:Ig-like domain-containing protein [Pseudomonadota bacterium]
MPPSRRLRPRLVLLAALVGLGAAPLVGDAALVGVVGLVPAAGAATAPLFEGQGLIELVRPTDLVGDGGSAADMAILALGPDGAPLTGWKVKLTATGGTVSEPVEAGGGLYRFTFTPALVAAPGTATLELKGKLANKQPLTRAWSMPVAPSRSRQLTVVANPAQLTLGVDKTANLAFTLVGAEPAAVAAVKLAWSVSAGTVANVTNLGDGQFNGLYTVPTTPGAQVALLTAVDSADPMRTYGGVAVPLTMKVDQAVTVVPNGRVILKVGGREFGPVTADSKGRAKVPIVVPPGASNAVRVQIAPDGTVTEAPLDLKVPEARRIALFPTAASIPSDGRLQIPVRAMVVTAEGRPDESAQVLFAASAGLMGPTKHEGGGVYVATFTPPNGNAVLKTTLTAKLADRPPIHTDTRAVNLVPVRATRVDLSATPPTLPAGATSLTVLAKVSGPDGSALAGRALSFSVDGAKLQEVKDLKTGEYAATFATTGRGPVEVSASVAAPATGNALAHVLVVPSRERLPPDGLSSAMLTVATLDEFGYPVPNVSVDLRVLSGDGSLPATATTNADGFARVYYTAGRKSGFVGIEVTAGERNGAVSLVQAPPALALPDLPVAGSATVRALTDEWAGAIPALRVERAE